MVQILLLPPQVDPSGQGMGNFSSGLVPGVEGGASLNKYQLARRLTERHNGVVCGVHCRQIGVEFE